MLLANSGTRNVPQVLRHYILLNSLRSMPIDVMMNSCANYPLLQKIKCMMLQDKASAKKEIKFYKNQLNNGTFRFKYKTPRQQGINYDPTRSFEEDLAGISYTASELMDALRKLDHWLDTQEAYVYPAEKEY